jgi:hypothetical protein
LEAIAARAFEERRAGGEECAMYWVSFASTDNGQIGIFAAFKQSERLSKLTWKQRDDTHDARADLSSTVGESIIV